MRRTCCRSGTCRSRSFCFGGELNDLADSEEAVLNSNNQASLLALGIQSPVTHNLADEHGDAQRKRSGWRSVFEDLARSTSSD